MSGLYALPGKQVTTVAQITAHTLSLLVLTLTYISALAASFLWSAMLSDGHRASSKVISKTRKIREDFLSPAEPMRASVIPKDNISNSGSTMQGVLMPKLADCSVPQILPDTDRYDC